MLIVFIENAVHLKPLSRVETFENGSLVSVWTVKRGFRKHQHHSHHKHRRRVYLSHVQMTVVAFLSILVWTEKMVKTELFENAAFRKFISVGGALVC